MSKFCQLQMKLWLPEQLKKDYLKSYLYSPIKYCLKVSA